MQKRVRVSLRRCVWAGAIGVTLAGLLAVGTSLAELRWRGVPDEPAVVVAVEGNPFGLETVSCDTDYTVRVTAPRSGLTDSASFEACSDAHQVGETVRLRRDGDDRAVNLRGPVEWTAQAGLMMAVGGGLALLVVLREVILSWLITGVVALFRRRHSATEKGQPMAESSASWQQWGSALARLVRRLGGRQRTQDRADRDAAAAGRRYPGDFRGMPEITYAPRDDAHADAGEVVWAWVPFEEDHGQGKDRPVLLIGRDGAWLLGLPLTSKNHDLDARQEASRGRRWVDIGSGAWDRQRRPSEARVDRVVRIDPRTVRRIGSVLDRGRFDAVADAVRRRHDRGR